ncbi:MAG: hypothetical protein KDC52_02885 [Ignavibacteriae bacterium]|nr:hypothetical protein [Ignavibacteriota bacterium]
MKKIVLIILVLGCWIGNIYASLMFYVFRSFYNSYLNLFGWISIVFIIIAIILLLLDLVFKFIRFNTKEKKMILFSVLINIVLFLISVIYYFHETAE